MKVLGHVGLGTGEVEPFDQIFSKGMWVNAKDIQAGAPLDALVIWGGEDISPSIYKEQPAQWCGAGNAMSWRDKVEVSACHAAIARGIPIIGVCRGAQLVCALAGGRLIQHVENHAGRDHLIETDDGKEIMTSSLHHQMMFPFGVDHKLIAWSKEKRSNVYVNQFDQNDDEMVDRPEPEICWFPKIKALAIQGHPEFHSDPERDPFVQYCMTLVRKYITGEAQ